MNRIRLALVPVLTAVVALSTSFGSTAPAFAQASPTATAPSSGTADTLVVSPPVTEQNAAPGQTFETKVNITNSTQSDRVFAANAQNTKFSTESGAPDLVPDEGPYALASWVSVTPNNVTIKAGQSLDFTVKIAVPKDAGPGSHSGAVVFSPSAPANTDGAAVSVVTEVSALFLVNVSGDTKQDTQLASFTAEKSFYQHGPVKFSARFTNNGNLVSRPEGSIKIKNVLGRTVATIPVEAQRVLPGATRNFDVTWDQKFLFGPYTAELTWHADSTSAAPTSVKIWGAPLKVIIPVVGGIVLLFLLVWLPRKRLKSAFRAFKNGPAE